MLLRRATKWAAVGLTAHQVRHAYRNKTRSRPGQEAKEKRPEPSTTDRTKPAGGWETTGQCPTHGARACGWTTSHVHVRPDRGWPSGEGTPLPPWTSVHGDHSHPGSGWNPTPLGLGLGHDKEGPTSVSGSGPALPQRGRRDGGHNRPSGTGSRARDGAGPAPIQAEPERGRGPTGQTR